MKQLWVAGRSSLAKARSRREVSPISLRSTIRQRRFRSARRATHRCDPGQKGSDACGGEQFTPHVARDHEARQAAKDD